jgi:hypothetical protein
MHEEFRPMYRHTKSFGPAVALVLALSTPAMAAPYGMYTHHAPYSFGRTTPDGSLDRAVTALDQQRYARADGWLEHGEVQLLNDRALNLAQRDANAGAQPLASTPALKDLEAARGDLLVRQPNLARQSIDTAIPLVSHSA